MAFTSINPATGEILRTYAAHDDGEVEAGLARAAETFHTYRKTSFAERARLLNRAADILDEERESLARLMTAEMGKTLQSARDEAAKCALACRYYVEHGEEFLADEPIATSAKRSFVRYQPLGPVLAVMPWNFPFWQVWRFLAPALMAGNVGLLKHASNVPGCALAIEEIVNKAGFPPGAFQTLLIESKRIEGVLADPRVVAATLTGSEGAGSSVAAIAGKHLKKTVLELGGSDPFIVMPSADIDLAVATAVKARLVNGGQSCIAAKRFIVHRDIYERFAAAFTKAMAKVTVGDPLDPATGIGPLATASIRHDVTEQVDKSVAAGARLLTGGKPFPGPGFYYPPTVLDRIPTEAPAYREEVFGPVGLLFEVPNMDAALGLANGTDFGLGSSVWTRDAGEVERFTAEIEAGQVFVNAMVASDPRVPFGGVKRSGYGRELSRHGIREFVNAKTVWLA